jgi:hypothetical protein
LAAAVKIENTSESVLSCPGWPMSVGAQALAAKRRTNRSGILMLA